MRDSFIFAKSSQKFPKNFAWTFFRESAVPKYFARTKFRENGRNTRKSRKLIHAKINPLKVHLFPKQISLRLLSLKRKSKQLQSTDKLDNDQKTEIYSCIYYSWWWQTFIIHRLSVYLLKLCLSPEWRSNSIAIKLNLCILIGVLGDHAVFSTNELICLH